MSQSTHIGKMTRALFLLLVASCSLLSAKDQSSGLRVLSSSTKQLIIEFNPVLERCDTLQLHGSKFLAPRFHGLSVRDSALYFGNQPCLRELISVPGPSGWRIASCRIKTRIMSNTVTEDLAFATSSGLGASSTKFSERQFVDVPKAEIESWVHLEYLGISGMQKVARLVIPVVMEVSANAIQLLESIQLTILFEQTNEQPISNRSSVQMLHTLNNEIAEEWMKGKEIGYKSEVKGQSNKTSLKVQEEVLSDGTWLKVAIPTEGVYRIDAQTLAKSGISIPLDKVSTLKMFSDGGEELSEVVEKSSENVLHEHALIVKTNADGSFKEAIFYAPAASGFTFNSKSRSFEHFLNHYTKTNYFLLTWGGKPGKRQEALSVPAADIVNTPTQFTARVFNEEEIINAYLAGSGRRWFGRQIDAIVPHNVSTKLPGLISKGNVNYVIDVAHREVMASTLRATVTVFENSNALDSTTLRGVNTDAYQEYVSCKIASTIPATALSADATSNLRFEYRNPYISGGGNGFVDFIEIHYPAQLTAIDDQLCVYSDIGVSGVTKYNISGFSSSALYGFDVTNPVDPLLLSNTSNTGGIYCFVRELDSLQPKKFFVASKLLVPDIQKIDWKNLRSLDGNADVVLITPREFEASALKYKAYREAHSKLKVAVIDVEDIYNEYGSCIQDPTAIRDFMADAFRRWTKAPHYLILWGDGHYDYKNITTQKKNFITTWQTNEIDGVFDSNIAGYYTSSYTTDDYFARVAGNDVLTDVALGRLPLNSNDEGQRMLDKIQHYETESAQDVWQTTGTFIADDSPTSNGEYNGSVHVDQSEDLTFDSLSVPRDIISRKIYLPEYPSENIPKGRLKPRVTEDILSMVNNRGTLLLNWIGHGSPKVWAHETILSRDVTIPQFTNYDKLFFLVAATCDFGRCDLPDNQSGSELMLMSDRGGAIGTFSSSRVSFSSFNAVIGREIFKQVFTRGSDRHYRSLGDIVMSTKQLLSGENDQKYFLLGDPTLHLNLPELVVTIDSINGFRADSSVSVSALSTMKVSGFIHGVSSKNVTADFNGSVTLSLFDVDVIRRIQDPSGLSLGDSTVFVIDKLGGALHRGNYTVKNGRFYAEFVVPKDISFSNKNGKLFAYAQSDDQRHAKGMNSSFRVGGILSTGINDLDGPEIKLFMDARTFLPGDVVRKNPLLLVDLYDKTGINSTGIGIGHKIEAWVDDNIESIDLSEFYSSSLTDSRRGTAVKQLFALNPGYHSVRVRVWDVLNNYSEAHTYFNVGSSENVVNSSRILIYPNPFSTFTTIVFTHNQTYSFFVEASIYNSVGQVVRTFKEDISSLQSGMFQWDGKDEGGSVVSQGTYTVLLQLHAPDGSIQTKSGLVILNRN